MMDRNYGVVSSALMLSVLVLKPFFEPGHIHPSTPSSQRDECTYFDRMLPIGLAGNLGALKVNAVRGSSMFNGLALISCGLIDSGPATIPSPVSTRA